MISSKPHTSERQSLDREGHWGSRVKVLPKVSCMAALGCSCPGTLGTIIISIPTKASQIKRKDNLISCIKK